jgi:hypothetical protein
MGDDGKNFSTRAWQLMEKANWKIFLFFDILLMNVVGQFAVERVPVLGLFEPLGKVASLRRSKALQRHDS